MQHTMSIEKFTADSRIDTLNPEGMNSYGYNKPEERGHCVEIKGF
jgi:hypothetical protein